MLITSAILINGVYNITRGEWVTKPNGDKEYEGMIFKGWSKYLNQHIIKIEYYPGEEMMKQFVRIRGLWSQVTGANGILAIYDNSILVPYMTKDQERVFIAECAVRAGVLVQVRDMADKSLISIYKEEKHYKLPELIRMPLGGCITCMSSVWGTISWILWYHIALASYPFNGTPVVRALYKLPLLDKTLLWVAFMVGLAYLNELFFHANHKLKS